MEVSALLCEGVASAGGVLWATVVEQGNHKGDAQHPQHEVSLLPTEAFVTFSRSTILVT